MSAPRRGRGAREAELAGDTVALASALIRIPSVNPSLEEGGAGEADIAAFCADILRRWGLDTRVVPVERGRPNVVAVLPGGRRSVLLNGHLDTVGVRSMSDDPFSGVVRDGLLFGRGACDMKGGVAAILGAVRCLRDAGDRPTVIVALTADEEHASLGMQKLVSSGIRADCAVVCEPTGLAVMPAHKGFVWLEALFRGKAAHGSRPDLGVDAIRHAALFVSALDDITERLRAEAAHPLLGRRSLHCGTIRGGTTPSVYPDTCRLRIERRTLPGEDEAGVLAEVRAVAAGLRAREPELEVDVRIELARPASEVPSDRSPVPELIRALETTGGAGSAPDTPTAAPAIGGMTAWVDAAYLNEAGVPAVCFGPGSLDQAHADREWVRVEEIRRCSRVLERFVLAWGAG